ncbi:GNAT family N-acetyltransferase [Lawsonibacter celer]|uniref:GNAT family N-acetyltransferase n=1 Tax=Lawsonibacter celer TaxID=2986526 RepID=UPI00311AAB24
MEKKDEFGTHSRQHPSAVSQGDGPVPWQFSGQRRILEDDEYHFTLVCDEGVFVGLVLYWEWETNIYIEHLCTLPEVRNKGYGRRVLSMLEEAHKTLILEIDPPVDELSRRRKGFYERCGFAENPYEHIHPPYHWGNSGHELVVMTWPGRISREEYNAFARYLHERVMDRAFT